MKIDVEIETIGKLPNDNDWRQLFARAGVLTRATVMQRIADGVDLYGDPMLDGASDKYTPAYERRKIRRGRSPYTPGDRLRWSGQMQRDFGVLDADDAHCDIGFHTLEGAQKAVGNDRLRPTFGLSDDEVDMIWTKIKELI